MKKHKECLIDMSNTDDSPTMTIKKLKEAIKDMPDDLDVFIRKNHITGNIEYAGVINMDTYGFFGKSVPCAIIEEADWSDPEEVEDEE
jgi:hypothetical protein